MPDNANIPTERNELENLEKTLDEKQQALRKTKRKNNALLALNCVLCAAFAVICTFSIYRCYGEARIYEKPAQTDENQQKITEEPATDENQNKMSDSSTTADENSSAAESSADKDKKDDSAAKNDDSKGSGHFSIYSVGDAFTAAGGSGSITCDIRNVNDSTHDIIVTLYMTDEELKAHGLSTEGSENGKVSVAQSGLFEPGYQITSIQLNSLPDGSYLPAGKYSLIMNEKYYDHETGVLSAYEANIPVTLEVSG